MENKDLEKLIECKKKYFKYKEQYLQLKNYQSLQQQDINNDTYLLFITSKLISDDNLDEENKSQIDYSYITPIKRKNNKPSYLADYTINLTHKLTEYLTPISKKRMLKDIEKDNDILVKLSKMDEKTDPDYINYENYGKLIESWLSDNLACPCCGSYSLKRYFKSNMPIIDVVCINPYHTLERGVRFFQIKTSNGKPFMDIPYFIYNPENPEQNHIHVGSRKYGEIVHQVKVSDNDFNKKILIGYICLTYEEKEKEKEDELKIIKNKNKSFIVLPIIDYQLDNSTSVDDWYYQYIDETNKDKKHSRIRFNHNTNKIVEINLTENFIPKNYKIRKDLMDNPLNNLI
jgi:hypothetical protein